MWILNYRRTTGRGWPFNFYTIIWTLSPLTMKRRKIILMSIFVLGAVFASYPAFCTHYFKATFDGQIHLIKFEAVTEALKHFTLPQLVNFMGYQNVGEAFNGMYPWLSGLIFIIPRLFISEPIYALFAGFVLLNLITMVNTYP